MQVVAVSASNEHINVAPGSPVNVKVAELEFPSGAPEVIVGEVGDVRSTVNVPHFSAVAVVYSPVISCDLTVTT